MARYTFALKQLYAMEKVIFHIRREHYRSILTNGKHEIITDEPAELGGSDLGLSPIELLIGSLAACTGITLRMYADRKGWLLEEIQVSVSMQYDKHANKNIIYRHIQFIGDLTQEQQNRLLEIANACPIHKTLQNPIDIITQHSIPE
ncbi:MAG: OsmC family protein [Bernardetiaceae bacterium]|nr:OsmC family protein [Bernardetiaceae bacterium]